MQISTLIEKLVLKAVEHFAAHNHIFSPEEILPVSISRVAAGMTITQQTQMRVSYCTECSALRYTIMIHALQDGTVYVKNAAPNIYKEET